MKAFLEENLIKIFVSNEFFDFEEKDNLIEQLIKKIKKWYFFNWDNVYFIKVYHDFNYGYLLEIFFNDDEELFFLDDDINVQYIKAIFKFLIDDDYKQSYLSSLKENNWFFIKKPMSNIELGFLLEHTIKIEVDRIVDS